MALEVVGGSFLSALFQTLFEKMASPGVVDLFRKRKLNQGLLKKLKIVLLSANAVLDDAEEKQLRSTLVRDWLAELKEATYDAEDLQDAIATKTLQREIKAASPTRKNKVKKLVSTLFDKTGFEKEIEPKIEEIVDRLKFVIEQKDVLGLKEGFQNRGLQRLLATSLVEESSVYGRDHDKSQLIKLLLSNDVNNNNISVIPIVGMGGIGKTTLAQLIYNDDRVKKHFGVKAWVTVSDEFDIPRITKGILDQVTTSQACDDIKDLNQLQIKLKEALSGKKFFFVLDDVWNKNYDKWDHLRKAFKSGAHGSKIIVTTRDAEIASMMSSVPAHKLGTLSDEDCWKLFAKHVFDDVSLSTDQNLEIIGRKIVKRCKGLPLAVKSLIGLLRSNPNSEEWEKILRSDIWELPNDEIDILPALWLSYHYLPPHLKRCFAYCSIFPKDFEFQKEQLILLWKAEDLLPHQKNKNIEEVGEEYFDILISRSLLQESNRSVIYIADFKHIRFFHMHDLVNDLSKFVSGEFCFILDNNDSNTPISKNCRHLSYEEENICDLKKFEALSQAKSLRTLLALGSVDEKSHWKTGRNKLPYEILEPTLLSTTQCLRVLSLFGYAFKELPNSIGNLKHLRYLDLSHSLLEKVPDTLCSLHNLQILLLSYCKNFTLLPNNIGGLVNLQHLDVRSTPLKNMPQDVCDLKNLQILSDFVLGEYGGSNIDQLKKLHNLREGLCISGLENIVDVDEISETTVKDMKYIRELTLRWGSDSNDPEKENVVLDKLQPHTNLKKFFIYCYRGTRFPDWLGHNSFSNTTTMVVEDCTRCLFLPPLGQLPCLKELRISGFDELVSIGSEFYSNGTSSTTEPFRSLKELYLENMSSWKEWSFRRANREGGVVFPSLTTLEITTCKQLVTLVSGEPQQTHTPFPSLESIWMSDCSRLESFLEWGSFSRLNSIQISHCEKLFALRMQWDLQRFTSLKSLGVSFSNDTVYSFPEEGLLPTFLTSLAIHSCQNLKALNGKSFQQHSSLKSLRIYNCKELQCLPEEGLPISLRDLTIKGCPLLSKRCQRENGEDWPKIAHISDIEIDEIKI